MSDEEPGQVSEDDWAAAMGEQATVEAAAEPPAATKVFEQFSEGAEKQGNLSDYSMILDIPVSLTVELGRTQISIRDLLQLAHGSVVELHGLAGEPMVVLVNGTLIAQGEVVVVNDKFGIRLTDIATPHERLNKLR